MPDNDYGIGGTDSLPKNPGPAALGHEPLIGQIRKENDLPVVRERVVEAIDSTEAVDVPDDPVFPILNTE
jgi:hypothetical protein